jgi:hypothetical protein
MTTTISTNPELTCIEIELDGATEWLLTTNPAFARQYITDIHATEVASRSILDVIHEQYGDVALLTTLG